MANSVGERIVLVDTSSWIHFLRADGDPVTRDRVSATLEAGTARWCAMVQSWVYRQVTCPSLAPAGCVFAIASVHAMRDVVPREGIAPLFTLFACAREHREMVVENPFVVRDGAGVHTEEMTAARAVFGMRDQR